MLTPSSVIQRREPFPSGPMASASTIKMMLTAKMISAERRIARGDRKETPTSTMKYGARNITWRLKKWKGSSPIRVATGGLAASDRMTPVSISTRIAPSSGLSTVHHHSVKGVRSSRESMGGRLSDRDGPLVAEVGLRGVKESGMFGDELHRSHVSHCH